MRDKQIEDMALDMSGSLVYFSGEPKIINWVKTLENMYSKGYRKASDVALETVDSFQRILRHIFLNMCDGNDYERLNLLQIDSAIETLYDSFIAELKKKYESEEIK